MSFRIDDILNKDKDFSVSFKKQNANNVKKEEFLLGQQNPVIQTNIFLETDPSKLINFPKINTNYITGCQAYCVPCVQSQSQEVTTNNFTSSDFVSYPQEEKACCLRTVALHDKIYTSPHICPQKIYPQTSTYNHVLPINFPIYQYYPKRRNQVRFSSSQTKALENKFAWQKYLSTEDRKLLAHSLKLSDRQVKTWFQNRRAKWRRNVNDSSHSDLDITQPVT